MKKAIAIAAAVIFLLLVIPIPTGVYKDGGTRTYTALTYKIVVWNHLYEEGIYKKTKVYPFPMNFWSLDRLEERERPNMEKELGRNDIGVDPDTTPPEEFPVSFEAQYIRTDGYHEGQIYPQVRVIRSVRELQAYYEANQDRYALERRETPASDSTIGFLDACDRYDETYFEDRILVMVLLEEGSGSTRHRVEKALLTEDGGKPALVVDIQPLVPEVGTCDMAEWHILIEPEAGVDVEEENITVLYNGMNPLLKPTRAACSRNFANISLTLPAGWTYQVSEERAEDNLSLEFWPEGQKEGRLCVRYLGGGFGVCGTGLTEEKTYLGSYGAIRGTYDGDALWSFQLLTETPGTYVVFNEGADAWWDEYGPEAEKILCTLAVGEGILTEAQAVKKAELSVTVEYDQVKAVFNPDDGCWTVNFWKKDMAGGDQTVILTSEGKVLENIYGE